MGGSEGPGRKNGPILMAIGGFGVELASRLTLSASSKALMLDTDRRSLSRAGSDNKRLVGANMVGGEGCGGNLNMARACFRKEMEEIASIFLQRSPVILLSSSTGATGLAGSAEIGGILVRTDRPSFSILVRSLMEQSISSERHLSSVMLDGPLRPGCLVSLGPSEEQWGVNDEVHTELDLVRFVTALLSVFSDDAPLPMDISALNDLRKAGGTYRVRVLSSEGTEIPRHIPMSGSGPGLVIAGVEKGTSVERMRKLSGALLEGREGSHIGFYGTDGPDSSLEGFIIERAPAELHDRSDQPSNSGPGVTMGPDDPELGSQNLVEGGFSPSIVK